MNTLFLRLEGPLQAWGLRARWGERDTADAPTKSGLLGLLGSALGYYRGDERLRALSNSLRMGVRVDLPGSMLRDYHTTGGGRYGHTVHTGGSRFHDDDYVGGVLSAEVDSKGRIKVKINQSTKEPETDVSERFYLADASFLVALHGSTETIERLADAVQRPMWPAFLGRKSCVPAAPIFDSQGQFDDLRIGLEAGSFSPRVLAEWERPGRRPTLLRMLIEVGPGEGNSQRDNIAMPGRRVFRPRYVREVWWALPSQADTPARTYGDAPINTLEG